MNRQTFVALATSSFVAFPRGARATGGLDVAGPSTDHRVRVLLASDAPAQAAAIDAWHFAWNGRTYRGRSETVRLADGSLGLVNTLPLDAYLMGVLGKEISASWAPEAQRAQAIASRTYVLGKIRPEKPYDIVATQSDQRYDGIESETVEGRSAVDATSGTIVTFGALPAHVAYSACCGGCTADAGDVWNTPYPYLPNVVDPYCVGTPAYAWDVVVPASALETAFGTQLATIGDLRAVRVAATSAPAGRPQAITFAGARSDFTTTPQSFRTAVGPGVVRSTFIRAASYDGSRRELALRGTGRGHGVGLCQSGARVMGDRGSTAAEILAFYFPGTALGRA